MVVRLPGAEGASTTKEVQEGKCDDSSNQRYRSRFRGRNDRRPHPLPRLDRQFLVRAFFAPQRFHPGVYDGTRLYGSNQAGVHWAQTKIIGLSVDAPRKHTRWAADIEETQGSAPNYPLIGDADLKVSKLYGMLPASTSGVSGERTTADNQTVRNVFIISPDKRIRLILVYPMTTGRNFDEVLRVLDSLQLTATFKVATPANWRPGEDVIIAGSGSDEQARKIHPQGWKAPKPYIRLVPPTRRFWRNRASKERPGIEGEAEKKPIRDLFGLAWGFKSLLLDHFPLLHGGFASVKRSNAIAQARP